MHVFKIPLDRSDLFIIGIDREKGSITYEVREKDTGQLLEPRHTSKLEFYPDKVYFDNRFLSPEQFRHVYTILMIDTPVAV